MRRDVRRQVLRQTTVLFDASLEQLHERHTCREQAGGHSRGDKPVVVVPAGHVSRPAVESTSL